MLDEAYGILDHFGLGEVIAVVAAVVVAYYLFRRFTDRD